MDFEDFKAIAAKAFPLTETQLRQFQAMDGLYEEWNAKINVISRKDIGGLYPRHVLHSLSIARYMQEEWPDAYADFSSGKADVLDLGTGGGFPGLPLAVLFPESRFTLCDSVGKKTIVASAVAQGLGLTNVEVVNARAESLPRKFGYVVSRAVASLDEFYPWVKGKFTSGILCLKGGDIIAESALMCRRCRVSPSKVSAWKVSSWLDGPDYDGKYVVRILP